MPMLPVVVRVEELMSVAFKVVRLVLPATAREDRKLTPLLTVNELPIPTLPDRLDAPEIPRVAPDIDLVTDNESKRAADDTVKDWPIPTFPETFMDEPIPTKPLKNPEP